MDSRARQLKHAQMISRLRRAVGRSGVTPTALAIEAKLHHDAIQRKLTGRDSSLMKETTFEKIEAAADKLAGEARPTGHVLEAELEQVEREMAQSIDELVTALIDAGVLTEEQLPEHLRRLIDRRRLLVRLLTP